MCHFIIISFSNSRETCILHKVILVVAKSDKSQQALQHWVIVAATSLKLEIKLHAHQVRTDYENLYYLYTYQGNMGMCRFDDPLFESRFPLSRCPFSWKWLKIDPLISDITLACRRAPLLDPAARSFAGSSALSPNNLSLGTHTRTPMWRNTASLSSVSFF